MKRFILWTFVLIVGAGLGVGGFYTYLNWDQLNPFAPHARVGHDTTTLMRAVRQACLTDQNLHGAMIRRIETTQNKLLLEGWIANKEQQAKIEELARNLLAESPDMQKSCPDGVAATLTLFPLDKHLLQLQHDFEECRDLQDDAHALVRSVMRTTRLDRAGFTEDAKLHIDAVCIRGNTKQEVSTAALRAALKHRFEASGLAPEQVPPITLELHYFTSPVVLLQKALARTEGAQDVRITGAWYSGAGKLQIDGIVRRPTQKPLVNKTLDTLIKDPGYLPIFRPAGGTKDAIDIDLNLVTLEDARDLHQRLIERARKNQRPLDRRFRIVDFSAEPQLGDNKQPTADDEGTPLTAFRVVCQSLLLKHPQREQAERELVQWLAAEMPKVTNVDQLPIRPEIEFRTRQTPALALQERLIERELDGAVIADTLYDETGRLELIGRLPDANEDTRKEIDAALKELLADDAPWTSAPMLPHQARKEGTPFAWHDIMRATRTQLASDDTGKRVRLDRLYYRYEREQLRLVAGGVFLTSAGKEDPAKTITRAVDDVIGSRGNAPVSLTSLRTLDNPLPTLQNLAAERPELDGVLLTQARYAPEGTLHVDGFVGQRGQTNVLAGLLGASLGKTADLVKPGADAKKDPGWSIDGVKMHALPWADVIRGCQTELANEPALRRASIERMHFRSADAKPMLVWKATYLTRPEEKVDEPALSQKVADACKTMLADLPNCQVSAALTHVDTPIYALQQLAVKDKHDGMLFHDAYFDREGKLVVEGKRGSEEQLKDVKTLLDKVLADAKPPLAPAGVASFERITLVPWQPLLTDIRTQFAQGDAFHKQTRIDRVFFQHDDASKKTVVHVHGIRIYQGKKLSDEAQSSVLRGVLEKQLGAKGIEKLAINLAGIERKPDPAPEMQTRANDAGIDGIVFSIGFDAKGGCYIQAPFIPKGHEENVRKLLEEYSKKHPHLGTLQLRQAPG